MILASKYRPTQFNEVVGQKQVTYILGMMVEKKEVPSALLFTGPRGVGKTSTARILGSALNGINDHTSVLEIDAASNGLVGDIRQLKEDLQYFVEGTRVVIIDEAHSMSREGFNALLKMLEEPPEGTIFVLVTTEGHKIPPTVVSRCVKFEFKRASVKSIYEKLVSIVNSEEFIDIDPNLLIKIAKEADGSFRDAIHQLDRCITSEILTTEHYEELLGEFDFTPGLFTEALKGHAQGLQALDKALFVHPADSISDKLIELLQDLLVLKVGGDIWASPGEPAHAIRAELAKALSTVDIVQALRLLWDLRLRMSTGKSDNNLKLCFTMISEVLTGKVNITKKSSDTGKRITLDDI